MATKRLLAKIARATGGRRLPRALKAAPGAALDKLFDLPAESASDFGIEPGTAAAWYALEVDEGSLGSVASERPWDVAHAALRQGLGLDQGQVLVEVEPDLDQVWPTGSPPTSDGGLSVEHPCTPAPERPNLPPGPGFDWHLGADYSRLEEARDLAEGGRGVVVAHLDTGIDRAHRTRPQRLDLERARNFVEGGTDVQDRTPPGLLRSLGHGTGTVGILAGGRLVGMRPDAADTGLFLGGAPEATVVPLRVANGVVQFRTGNVAAAIVHAAAIEAHVLSMSMGGLASAAWADAVNRAYLAGVVMVMAAGNNFGGLPTPHVVYPARFARVIAVLGCMADKSPYFNLPPTVMQGNFGPATAMRSALAAFTPNVPWPKIDCSNVIDLDGAGTSSATPQVAAAAALWLARHGPRCAELYREPWQRVEAVRHALFGGEGTGQPDRFRGQGLLDARATLDRGPAAPEALSRTAAASPFFPFLRLLTGFGIGGDERRARLLALELTQAAALSVGAREAVGDPDVPANGVSLEAQRRFMEALLDEGKLSANLRATLETVLGRSGQPPRAGASGPGRPIARRQTPRPPARRRLRVFAMDPGYGRRHATFFLNRTTVAVRWEADAAGHSLLRPGPVGDYLEVVDIDPPSGCVYEPVDLDQPFLLAEDGLAPSDGNPQFHQQMVYAVVMRTIEHFERALGRPVAWAGRPTAPGSPHETYVHRLRIYPHALREANAYYSPARVALLFGYFQEVLPEAGGRRGGTVFTCVSHDVVAHEATHAILDGHNPRFREATNPDVLAFHEAFADIIAIFQHFTFPELLEHEIQATGADLGQGNRLAELARQFGEAMGRSKALRNALGVDPRVTRYADTPDPHTRGSILVAAVFDAFVAIYRRRTADLLRIATGGSGILGQGALHPDLVARLAREATIAAGHVLTICIRAIDYCPPVDITFADYLRALVTADADLVPDDPDGYRVAFLEAFQRRGVVPADVRTISVESLVWKSPYRQPAGLGPLLHELAEDLSTPTDRRAAHVAGRQSAERLHAWLTRHLDADLARDLGLCLDPEGEAGFARGADGRPQFEVAWVRPARRVTLDGQVRVELIALVQQSREVPRDPARSGSATMRVDGGATLVMDPTREGEPIRYAVVKNVLSERRLATQRAFLAARDGSGLHGVYDAADAAAAAEPFGALHRME